jgi:hypothetical protein
VPPIVTDGPFPESKELLAGYRMIDVESVERALEIAAEGSAAPGPDGAPIMQRIEVRESEASGEMTEVAEDFRGLGQPQGFRFPL